MAFVYINLGGLFCGLKIVSIQVQEVLDEIGHPGIPLSVISKAAEIQLLYAVDKVLLGNRWLRKATGIQPKFPYMVDSFENRYILCNFDGLHCKIYVICLIHALPI